MEGFGQSPLSSEYFLLEDFVSHYNIVTLVEHTGTSSPRRIEA
jgi:hypothetical protein